MYRESSPQGFPVPAEPLERTIEVKRSRFIARAARVESREACKALLEQAQRDHPDARHHCSAYLLGNPAAASQAGMNDDGEPSGTAGRSILNVLQHKGVGNVMVVVIRYFGGIKLGAGGLTRAYSRAAEAVMAELAISQWQPGRQITLLGEFSQEQPIRYWLSEHHATIERCDYGNGVAIEATIRDSEIESLERFARGSALTLLSGREKSV